MYARSTILQADPTSIDAGVAEVRNTVVPAIEQMPGFAGYSMLIDRDSGRCIVTTSWLDEGALADSREKVRELRRRTAATFGAAEPEVLEWEVASVHRARPVTPGACARVTRLQVPTHRLDRQVEVYRSIVLPRLEALDGFCSGSLLLDRASGRAAGAVVYESREALEATRDAAKGIRAAAVQEVGAEITEVSEYEVALAHLRVPENV